MAISYDPITDRIIVSANPGMDVTLPFKMRANYGAAAATSPDADWLARSTYTGVVWAHDFTTSAEVTNFMDNDPASQTGVSHSPAGGITGGSLVINLPGNPISTITSMTSISANVVRVTTSATLQVIVGDHAVFRGLPSPWNGFNDTHNGGQGLTDYYNITVINSATSFDVSSVSPNPGQWPTINTTGFAAYAGGSATCQRGRTSIGGWSRPFSALLAGGNGLAADDRGVAAPELLAPGRTWPMPWNLNRTYAWHRDYYGHGNYASRLAVWPDGNGTAQSGQYRGTDFWLQFRLKIPLARYQDSTAAIRNEKNLKGVGIFAHNGATQEIILYDTNTVSAAYGNYLAADGGIMEGYTGGSNTHGFEKGTIFQAGGDYNATCVGVPNQPASVNACWHWRPDEYICFLLHVIPGAHYPNWAGWPTPSDPNTATGIQLWACPQSRIDTMRAAGQTVTYQSIYNTIGANGWPFVYDNNALPLDNNSSAPAYNMLWLMSYANGLPVTFGYTRQFTQLIFKKGNGGNNPVTDGIPCPQV